jgi:hypothetical protein
LLGSSKQHQTCPVISIFTAGMSFARLIRLGNQVIVTISGHIQSLDWTCPASLN